MQAKMTDNSAAKTSSTDEMMHRHDHSDCLHHAMQAAETVCTAQNIRLTPARKRILELICSNHQAIGAYQLLDQLKQEDHKAKPATIYRALDFLMAAGLVHKVESLNAYIGCLTAEKDHHSAILICDQCHNAYEINAESIYQNLFAMSQTHDFQPKQLILELHGVCTNCKRDLDQN